MFCVLKALTKPMTQKTTEEQLILLAYGELNAEERLQVEKAMAADSELRNRYHRVLQSKQLLNTIQEEPHPTSVAIIMEHSHDSHTEAV
jgi:anti-sigma factor RsiW